MAIKATFIADFASFQTAVQKAELELGKLAFKADDASASLTRMVDRFSGRKITSEAVLMAEAVERIGGVGKLTAQELQRVGATAQEAAAKLRALGKDVPPEIQKIADQTAHLNKTQHDLIGTLKNLAGAFGVVFSVQAIAGFVSKVIDAAGAINDMADKLGISTAAVQEFGFAAEQSGSNMETVGRAISEMNKSLATGDNSTREALALVGLQFEHIRSLSPEEAFREIAAAVQEIPDPMEQTRIATELFGKAGKELLPAIKAGFVALAEEAPKMSAATIRALDEIGDAWAKLKAQIIVATAEIIASIQKLPKVTKQTADELNRIADIEKKAREGLTVSVPKAPFVSQLSLAIPDARLAEALFNRVNGTLEQQAKRVNASVDAQKKAKKLTEQLADAFERLGDTVDRGGSALGHIGRVIRNDFDNPIQDAIDNTAFLERHFRQLWDSVDRGGNVLRNIGQSFGKLNDSLVPKQGGFVDFLKNGLGSLFSDKEGNAASSFGEGFKNALGGIGTGIFNELGALLTGGIGSIISKGISLLGKGLGKLFGFDAEKKKVDEMRQAFIDQIGGWHKLNEAAQKTGMTLDKVLNAKKVKDYEKAVAELQRRLDLQATAWQKAQAAIEKYGFTLEELGPALQRQKLTSTALELYEDFLLLTGAGIDAETVLRKMAEKINAFTQLAVKMGISVDIAMKPIIQKMIEMGLLVDENGNLITDLESSGISFTESMTDAFRAVADELREMVELLRLFLGLTREIPNLPGVPQPTLPPGAERNPKHPDADVQSAGGRYLDVGQGALAMGASSPLSASEGGVTVNVYGSVLSEYELGQTLKRVLSTEQRMRFAAA